MHTSTQWADQSTLVRPARMAALPTAGMQRLLRHSARSRWLSTSSTRRTSSKRASAGAALFAFRFGCAPSRDLAMPLAGTSVRRWSLIGTAAIVAGCTLVVCFTNKTQGVGTASDLLARLSVKEFEIYTVCFMLMLVSLGIVTESMDCRLAGKLKLGQSITPMNKDEPPAAMPAPGLELTRSKLDKAVGFLYAVLSGVISSLTLFISAASSKGLLDAFQGNQQAVHSVWTWLLVLLLLFSCFLQQRWFNAALRMETARRALLSHAARPRSPGPSASSARFSIALCVSAYPARAVYSAAS